MDIREAIIARHSVRRFKTDPIPAEIQEELRALIAACNEESGLKMQLVMDDPACFALLLGRYGVFKNANHYIAVVGPASMPGLDEKGGYYGQKIVLNAQILGLNTCWIGGTFNRGKCKAAVGEDERLVCIIAVGYGETSGVRHKDKPLTKVCDVPVSEMPTWFKNGVKAAMMAPTAMNQQKFFISLDGEEAVITAGRGAMTKLDLGIVKYNFEAASGHKCR